MAGKRSKSIPKDYSLNGESKCLIAIWECQEGYKHSRIVHGEVVFHDEYSLDQTLEGLEDNKNGIYSAMISCYIKIAFSVFEGEQICDIDDIIYIITDLKPITIFEEIFS